MSRLDLFIDRMMSQRACLNHAVKLTSGLSGPVFELGLGNGRTYHHMCEILPPEDIFVFERAIASHPDSTPPD
ncbi:MAG: class I SAM-dependent methyltransferase, partial [Roseobacter sp.]|nr:class I SAM-dependent methyltransferase [Roseobacter sp.]